MKKISLALAAASVVTSIVWQGVSLAQAEAPQPSAPSHTAVQSHQRAQIVDVIHRYQTALNANDTAGVTEVFTDDAALLLPNAPTAVGLKAVRDAYARIFQTIDLDLTFSVADVELTSPGWALLRSTSQGPVTIRANGAQVQSSNQELFVLHCVHGHWKLARYAASSVLPA